MNGFYIFIMVLIMIVCVLLAIVVLVQNSKGGGLAANFSAPNQIMGVRKTTDFLEKTTWTLVIILVVLSLVATATISTGKNKGTDNVEINTENVVIPTTAPVAPVAAEPVAAEMPAAE
ncbi:MAG: preprotein translocase subunit SecG [Bacteroidales bacterium]|nr:preprotein translocase subunit SecG [Bacteroidales bacterium]